MNIYGRSTGGEFDGNLPGDLIVGGDGQVNGDFDVAGELRADTIISRVSLEVKDPLIECGVDNPADMLNLGLKWSYNDGIQRWGGMVRDRTTKRIVLFKDSLSKPTPATDLASFSRADIDADGVYGRTLNASASIDSTGGVIIGQGALNYKWNIRVSNVGFLNDLLTIRSSLGGVDALPIIVSDPVLGTTTLNGIVSAPGSLIIGSPGDEYTMPNGKASAINKVLVARAPNAPIWDFLYDQSLNATDNVEFKQISVDSAWTIKQTGTFLEIIKITDTQYFSIRQGGFLHQYGATGSVGVEYKCNRGTISAPTATILNDECMELLASGHNGGGPR